jgi:hypothetical protein
MDVEAVQMLVAPVKHHLEDVVKMCQGGIAAHEETAPDEGADPSEDDPQLVDPGRCTGLAHGQSVPRETLCFKVSPRNLALSNTSLLSHQWFVGGESDVERLYAGLGRWSRREIGAAAWICFRHDFPPDGWQRRTMTLKRRQENRLPAFRNGALPAINGVKERTQVSHDIDAQAALNEA